MKLASLALEGRARVMAGDKEIGDETRNQMMQNLFGDESEDEEEEEVDSEPEAAANNSEYQSVCIK